MKRHVSTWLIFATCLLAATIAVAWLSRQTLQAERSERHARQQADLENRVRIALWRMDSIAVPLVAIESTRPALVDPSKESPALAPQLLKGYVQRAADGQWTVRRDPFARSVEPLSVNSVLIAHANWWHALPAPNARSLDLRAVPSLADSSVADPTSSLIVWPNNFGPLLSNTIAANTSQRGADQNANNLNQSESQSRSQLKQQVFDVVILGQSGQSESQSRNQLRQQFIDMVLGKEIGILVTGEELKSGGGVDSGFELRQAQRLADYFFGQKAEVGESQPKSEHQTSVALLPLWVGDELLLARRVAADGKDRELIEACWLNWPAWNEVLHGQIVDLLPDARLLPVTTSSQSVGDRELVALPVRLDPGSAILAESDHRSWPAALVAAWVMLALTAAAIAWLLWQTLHLSERRAAFVSAVTHELRTPLTTFRLYTEMLTDGLIQDRDQQQTYFRTLHREANRLMHMVENVLAYARLEKGRPTNRTEELSLGELLDRCWPRLSQRVSESPLQLVWLDAPRRESDRESGQASPDSVSSDLRLQRTASEQGRLDSRRGASSHNVRLTTNVMAVEQILFNLIDNACKYASDTTDPRITVVAEASDTQIMIQVRDFGPGLSPTARRELFEPFGKSSAQAAETAPGIGLGLSLARRLARDLGGDLQCDQHGGTGLAFVLTLPRDGRLSRRD